MYNLLMGRDQLGQSSPHMEDVKVRHFVVEYAVTWEPVTFNL